MGNDHAAALQALGIADNAHTMTVEQFFEVPAATQDWHGDDEKTTARRFATLRDLLLAKFQEAKVYKQGNVNVAIHIVAHADQYYALSTQAIET